MVCKPWRTLGRPFALYEYTERTNILDHQKFLYSIQLPGDAKPSERWLGPNSSSDCSPELEDCDITPFNLLSGSLEMDLCGEGPLQSVKINSMHLLAYPKPIEPQFASYDIEEQLKRCGVGPWALTGYPIVSDKTQIAHEVKYGANGESGWCYAEFENIDPPRGALEPDHFVVFSRFKRTRPDEFLQATLVVVADEKDIVHTRDVMIAIAKSLQVNWENIERYYPPGEVVPVKKDPVFPME